MRRHKSHKSYSHEAYKRRVRERKMRNKREERERASRDARMTREFGERAHRMCGCKKRYATKNDAYARALSSVHSGSGPLRVYQCPYCHGWHLTSKPPEE